MELIVRGNERMFPFPSPVKIVDKMGTPVEDESASVDADTSHGAGG
jgi:hypothetical protein